MFTQAQFDFRELFPKRLYFDSVCTGAKPSLFLVESGDPVLDSLQGLFQMLQSRLLDFGLLSRFGRMLVKLIPLLLPGVHGFFGAEQRFGRGLLNRLQHLQLWSKIVYLLLPGIQLEPIFTQKRF